MYSHLAKYILGVPCITLRDNTEWVETVNDGWNVLAGTDTEKIIKLAREFNHTHSQSGIFERGACEEITKNISEIGCV